MSIHKEIMSDFVDDFAVTVSVDKSTVSVYTTVQLNLSMILCKYGYHHFGVDREGPTSNTIKHL